MVTLMPKLMVAPLDDKDVKAAAFARRLVNVTAVGGKEALTREVALVAQVSNIAYVSLVLKS
jgi:hypothetical protein